MKKRTIGVLSVARSDSGIYLPVLNAIKTNKKLNLKLIVAAMHFSNEFGLTYKYIEKKGFKIDEKVEMTMSSDSPESIAKSMGLGTISFGQLFGKWRPDILVVLGDRYEMLSAVCAAMPFGIPIAHIHGGEATEGLIDEQIRHSITKMSHLHFVSTKEYYKRVLQLGEEDWRITLSGAPSLDSINSLRLWPKKKLEKKIGLNLKHKTLLVTFHPVTLDFKNTALHIQSLLNALKKLKLQTVFTFPNSDTAGRIIIEQINSFVKDNKWAKAVKNFGQEGYFSMMKYSSAMIGNSSSGIIESASFELPVLNIGDRQKGRVQSYNVINVNYNEKKIIEGIKKIIEDEFRKKLVGMKNPYGDGESSLRISNVLENVSINKDLIIKKFNNI